MGCTGAMLSSEQGELRSSDMACTCAVSVQCWCIQDLEDSVQRVSCSAGAVL